MQLFERSCQQPTKTVCIKDELEQKGFKAGDSRQGITNNTEDKL